MKTRLFLTYVSALLLASGAVLAAYAVAPSRAISQTTAPVTGYLWSETIGWISLDGSNYGVSIDAAGNLAGYAWSENIGWVKFGGLSGFPSGTGTTAANAKMSGSALTGWARACAGTTSGDCSVMTSRSDGWDGWIALSGTGYGPSLTAGAFSGYAWGSDVVGWVDTSLARTTWLACTPGTSYICTDSTHSQDTCTGVITTCTTNGPGWFCAPDTHLCTAPPPPIPGTNPDGTSGVLSARPSLVRSGDSTTLKWTILNATSCVITGNDGYTSGSIASSGTLSRVITHQVIYTLACSGDGGSLSPLETVTVSIIPSWQEQ